MYAHCPSQSLAYFMICVNKTTTLISASPCKRETWQFVGCRLQQIGCPLSLLDNFVVLAETLICKNKFKSAVLLDPVCIQCRLHGRETEEANNRATKSGRHRCWPRFVQVQRQVALWHDPVSSEVSDLTSLTSRHLRMRRVVMHFVRGGCSLGYQI